MGAFDELHRDYISAFGEYRVLIESPDHDLAPNEHPVFQRLSRDAAVSETARQSVSALAHAATGDDCAGLLDAIHRYLAWDGAGGRHGRGEVESRGTAILGELSGLIAEVRRGTRSIASNRPRGVLEAGLEAGCEREDARAFCLAAVDEVVALLGVLYGEVLQESALLRTKWCVR
jgi:hypothetical protein